MGIHPGTVSKILWHFTGGPEWDSLAKKQLTTLKPTEMAFDNLIKIIDSKNIRIGSYSELVKIVLKEKSIRNKITKKLELHRNYPIEITSSPVCCVADIPIQHLAYHAKRYGKIAIGFYRESIIKAGFNPVLYSMQNSDLMNTIAIGFDKINSIDTSYADSCLDDIEGDYPDADIYSVKLELEDIEEYKYESVEYYENILAFIKTFDNSEFDSIYCEREWRSLTSFVFSKTDIAMVILPKKDIKNYHSDFISLNKLPNTIPINCWEDLMEH